LRAVAKVLSVYCFSDRYRQGLGSYVFFNSLDFAPPYQFGMIHALIRAFSGSPKVT
jgi:hypothetical protein